MKHIPLFLALLVATVPFAASAATVSPTCAVAALTKSGQVWPMQNGKIFLLATQGEPFTVVWASANASSAHTGTGASIALSGYETLTPTKTTSYSYLFDAGGTQSNCSVTAVVLQSNLPVNTGTNATPEPIPSNTVGNNVIPSSSNAQVTASSVPLLSGGYAAPGASVPVAYLKFANISISTGNALINGVWLEQAGTADAAAITGFSTVDDKGMNRTTLGGTEGTTPFKNSSAYVPLNAVVAPGQIRIFTIKALLSRNLSSSLGSTLMLDVASIDTKAKVVAQFPIRGTTWTLRAY